MKVSVIQYLRPNGRQREESTSISDDYVARYRAMCEDGCRFAAEVLSTGAVSVTIEDPDGEEDKNIRIIPNGPAVQRALEEMLAETYRDY